MRLLESQLAEFDREGFIVVPDLFDRDEVDLLRGEAHRIYGEKRQEVVREKDGATTRTAFAAHLYNDAYRRLGRHPRLIGPVEQLLGGRVYMHQFKINAKAAFDGDVWQWHQDYGTWARDDLMPAPHAMNIAVALDDVTEFNGPLWFIPRSHKRGVLGAGHDLETTSYPLWTLDHETVAALCNANGIYSAKTRAGTVLLFHCNLVHASPPNISPWHRVTVYLSLCRVDNHIRQFKRAEWIAHRDFAPIEPLPDDCLKSLVRPAAA